MNEKSVIVGLSGGVDSSVAAYLLKEQGYHVVGVTMVNFKDEEKNLKQCEASEKMVEDAKKVADFLGIEHIVVDFRKEFEEEIINYFIDEYLQGRTPNPCVQCNRKIKWEALLKKADELGIKYLATGHYAKICRLENGRYAVTSSVTKAKDQTYALYGLTQKQLERTLMPVGSYPKDQIREIAKQVGIPVAAKPDSMEICFIPDNDYASFIENKIGRKIPEGNFVLKTGKVIGKHKGIIHYTIGQRKGLNLAMGHPVFVSEIRPEKNEVVIGENEDIFATALLCKDMNAMAVEKFETGMEVLAKIRYNHKGAKGILTCLEDGSVICRFEEAQRAITPGQALVLYQENIVLGGGTIVKAIKE